MPLFFVVTLFGEARCERLLVRVYFVVRGCWRDFDGIWVVHLYSLNTDALYHYCAFDIELPTVCWPPQLEAISANESQTTVIILPVTGGAGGCMSPNFLLMWMVVSFSYLWVRAVHALLQL